MKKFLAVLLCAMIMTSAFARGGFSSSSRSGFSASRSSGFSSSRSSGSSSRSLSTPRISSTPRASSSSGLSASRSSSLSASRPSLTKSFSSSSTASRSLSTSSSSGFRLSATSASKSLTPRSITPSASTTSTFTATVPRTSYMGGYSSPSHISIYTSTPASRLYMMNGYDTEYLYFPHYYSTGTYVPIVSSNDDEGYQTAQFKWEDGYTINVKTFQAVDGLSRTDDGIIITLNGKDNIVAKAKANWWFFTTTTKNVNVANNIVSESIAWGGVTALAILFFIGMAVVIGLLIMLGAMFLPPLFDKIASSKNQKVAYSNRIQRW